MHGIISQARQIHYGLIMVFKYKFENQRLGCILIMRFEILIEEIITNPLFDEVVSY